jgi:hypothetical protein
MEELNEGILVKLALRLALERGPFKDFPKSFVISA